MFQTSKAPTTTAAEAPDSARMPSLEYRLYCWLGAPVALLFALMTALMMFEVASTHIDDMQSYSNMMLEEGAAQIRAGLSDYEAYAAHWLEDFTMHREAGNPEDNEIDIRGARYDRAGVQSLIYSPSGQVIRYRRHVQGTSIVMTAERLEPDDPLTTALGRLRGGSGMNTGWGALFYSPGNGFLLPYAAHLQDVGSLLMLAPASQLLGRLETLNFRAGSSTFLALTDLHEYGGGGVDSDMQNYLRTVGRNEITFSGALRWNDVLAGLGKVTLYYPEPVLPGMYVGFSYDMLSLYDRLRRHLALGLAMAFMGIILLFVIIRGRIKYVSRSITDLRDRLERVSSGNLDVRLPENQRYREMAFITRAVNRLLTQIKGYVRALRQEAEKSASLASELAIAGRIQQDLLPSNAEEVVGQYRVDLGMLLAPAKKIAGDFYCLVPRPDGKLLFAVGDVSGKGIAAALVAKDCVSLFEMHGQDLAPAQLLQRMNAELFDRFARQSMFVTMFCGLLDMNNATLAHCDAGHETPLLHRAGDKEVGRLEIQRNMALGFLPDTRYEERGMQLKPGQTLLLYTDGLDGSPDKPDSGIGLPLGVTLLGNSLLANVDMQTRVRCIKDLALRQQGGEAYDDITMLGISPGRSEYRCFSIPPEADAVSAAINRLRATLGQEQTPADCVNNLSVILDEWLSNLVNYADVESDIVICCRYRATVADLEIIAACQKSIDPRQRPDLDVNSHLQTNAVGGFGIHIIRSLADDLSYQTESGWTRLNVRINTQEANNAT